MNAPLVSFSHPERLALQQMLQAPEAIECHGTDLAWQAALASALKGPSLRESLNFDSRSSQDVDGPGSAPR